MAVIRDMPRLQPVNLRPVSINTLSARQFTDAAVSLAPTIESRLATQERIDRQAFTDGIDRADVPGRIHVGPQHLTSRKALDIEQAGQAFLETASGTVSRLNIERASRMEVGRKLSTFRIPPPDRLPPRFRCPYHRSSWPTCNRSAEYRTFDGSCNNLDNPLWGRSQTPFERYEEPEYDDGLSSPRTASTTGGTLPNARKISREFHRSIENPMSDLSHMAMEYGQFVSHDIQFNALSRGYGNTNLDCCERPNRRGCFSITIPPNDPFYPSNRTCMNLVRSLPTPNLECTIGVRQQLNQNSHHHDASQVYGSDKEAADNLRTFTNGLLRTSVNGGDDLLPTNTASNAGCITSNANRPCFVAGDVRVNQQPALMSLQTIWLREHNRIARRLAAINRNWDDETLYQEARKIVIAEMQHITYNEYLPEILGETTMRKYDLKPRSSGFYNGYDRYEKPIIRNGFSAAAFRFGHSMIYHRLPTYNKFSQTSNPLLKETFLRPDLVYTRGVDQITRGLTKSPSETVDTYVTDQVTNHLFERQPGFGGDLAAINIQRGRDHGLPGYQVWRRHCGLNGKFSHSNNLRRNLLQLYSSADDIDFFTGGVSETPLTDGKVGPTFACIIGKQFQALKKGDRFYYENSGTTGFKRDQLDAIRKVTLSNVICRNTDIDKIQRKALRQDVHGNTAVNCRYIEDLDLSAWSSGGSGCTPVHGGWSAWMSTPCFGSWKLRYRLCNSPTPNECGRQCGPNPYEFTVQFCGSTLPWMRMDRPLGPDRSITRGGSGNIATPKVDTTDVTRQVETALYGLVGKKVDMVDASVFEKAISSISNNNSPVQAPQLSVGREPLAPRDLRGPRRMLQRAV